MSDPALYCSCPHILGSAQGLALNPQGRIIRQSPQADDLPLILLAHTAEGQTVAYLGDDCPVELQCELANQAANVEFPQVEPLLHLLRAYGIQPTVGHFKTYVFPEQSAQVELDPVKHFPKDDPKVMDFRFSGFADTVYAIEKDGIIRAACVSVRQDADCAESWVFTAPPWRRQGLAQKVVMAWARDMRSQGIVPFYSHKIENLASANLAAQLALIPVFEEIGIEPVHDSESEG